MTKQISEAQKGDRVQFEWHGMTVTGVVKRIKKDGTRTVAPDSDDVNEGCWIDFK